MDKIVKYQSIICSVLQSHDYQTEKVQSLFLADKEKHHYQLLTVGVDKRNAYYLWVRLHLQLKSDGKVWILENRTEYNIADELIAEGISSADIVLGTIPEDVRQYTGFAVA